MGRLPEETKATGACMRLFFSDLTLTTLIHSAVQSDLLLLSMVQAPWMGHQQAPLITLARP
jgi:hypothetical protein